jgi:hypothetical protein
MKKTTIVLIMVLVFVVIGVVVWLFMSSNKGNQVVTKTTESNGLANFFGTASPNVIKSLIG